MAGGEVRGLRVAPERALERGRVGDDHLRLHLLLEIQSHGIETLTNILDTLPDLGLYPSEYTFRTFNQRFSDECAGVFCNVSLEARKDGLCAEAYDFVEGKGSFDMSFDESFDCWRWVIDGNKTIYHD